VRSSLLALAATAMLAVAACSSTAATAAPTSAPSAAGSAAPAGGPTISIRNFSFGAGTAAATAGDTITWVNNDDAPHTVTFDDASLSGSGPLNAGDKFTLSIAKAGSYTYHCKIHPSMKATITVS
jgi:plastocyanin